MHAPARARAKRTKHARTHARRRDRVGARGAEMRGGYRLQPPIRVDLAATPRRPRNDSDNPSRGSARLSTARLRPVCVCVYVCEVVCVWCVCVCACVRASVRGRACMCVRVYRGLRLRRACGRMRRRAGWVGGGGGDFRPSKGRRYIAPPPMYAAEDVREEGGRRVCAADTHNTYIHTGTQIHTYRSASPPRVCMCARARAFVCVQRRLLRPGP